jgi:hypothetical protein
MFTRLPSLRASISALLISFENMMTLIIPRRVCTPRTGAEDWNASGDSVRSRFSNAALPCHA